MTGVIRGCSEINLGNQCRNGVNPNEPYQICIISCWENDCNSNLSLGTRIDINIKILFSLCLFSVLFLLKNYFKF
jgi:hypothetical protein